MRFYTNIQMVGNNFLVREYENGQRKIYREEYQPTLYVKSKKESQWKTLDGDCVEPIQPGTIRDCREFYKKGVKINISSIHLNSINAKRGRFR